jgi:hypothetical protein
MLALMVLHQIGHLPLHQVRPQYLGQRSPAGVSVHDDVGAVDQVPLVPLRTPTPLPDVAADVAELGAAAAGWEWGKKGSLSASFISNSTAQ